MEDNLLGYQLNVSQPSIMALIISFHPDSDALVKPTHCTIDADALEHNPFINYSTLSIQKEGEEKSPFTTLLKITMAALLPTILSDDEAEFSTTKSISDGKKKRSKKTKTPSEPKLKIDDSDGEGDSSDDEMDGDFEFGGVLVSSTSHIMHTELSYRCMILIVVYTSHLISANHREKTELHLTH